ncbi:hypothetical protein [Ferruginibacter sp.]|nr:hypothetical protein [Ferruginibacter sp.]
MKRPNLISSKTVFIATLIVVPTLILIIYFTGLEQHRTLYLNSLLSTTIISIVFLIFITTGLYNGWKLKDGIGNFLDKFQLWKKPSSPTMNVTEFEPQVFDEGGVEGCVISIAIWIVVGLLGSFIFWWLGAFIWVTVLVVAGLLYWIIFRAFRLIFRNSAKCKSNLIKSLGVALLFTFLYNCWIYAIIIGTHFLIH